MKITRLGISGAYLIESKTNSDDRGSLREWINLVDLESHIESNFKFAQANITNSKLGVLRGIHYSLAPEGQSKIITCIDGEIDDFIVDLRIGSNTFAKYIKVNLNFENRLSVLIEPGLGHGFVTKSISSTVIYLMSSVYQPEKEYAVSPFDDILNIVEFSKYSFKNNYLLSERDLNAPSLIELQRLNLLPKVEK